MNIVCSRGNDEFIWYGSGSDNPLSKETIGCVIFDKLKSADKGAVAMINGFTHEKLMYKQLIDKSIRLAQALRVNGYVGQETVLAVSSENCLDYFVPVFASFYNGSIIAPMNFLYKLYELSHILAITRPKIVFCSPTNLDAFLKLKTGEMDFIEKIILINHTLKDSELNVKFVITMDNFIKSALNHKSTCAEKFKPVSGDSSKLIAAILCSSGTTGLPKGVSLSHLNLMVRMNHSCDPRYHSQAKNQTVLGLIPFFHTFGFMTSFTALAQHHTVICLRKFDEDVFLKSIQDFKINTLNLPPTLIRFFAKSDKLSKYDLSCIKELFCGAAPLSKNLEEKATMRLNYPLIRQGYGLTETTLAVLIIGYGQIKPGSCGKVISYTMAKVSDPNTGLPLGPDECGELCFKSPSVMMGYYNNEKATKDAITEDGWLKTGDLGYYDKDGYFYVIDRLKELIKYNGYQVAPAELEAILVNHPQIVDAGVVGIPDEEVGEKPLAFVVRRRGATITEEDVTSYVADIVSHHKRLSGGVIFVDSIPRNPSGKILRRELRKWINQDISKIKSKL